MRRLHIVLLSLAIALSLAGTNAWAQRGGGHGGGGGGFHGGGGGGFHSGSIGGFRGGYGGGFRGGYGGYGGRGYGYGYRGWGWGRWGFGFGFGLGWWPWAYWPYWGYGYYGGWGYPYYSTNPCYPYGPYDCRISGYGPVASAPDPPPAGPNPATHSQSTYAPVTPNAYVGDGQWHRFGPRPAPATPAPSP